VTFQELISDAGLMASVSEAGNEPANNLRRALEAAGKKEIQSCMSRLKTGIGQTYTF